MNDDGWPALHHELDQWQAQGLTARLWLRDDDASALTPALEQLISLARRWQAPVLLAVIPALAQPALVQRLVNEPLVTPCQHGYAHINHAPEGEKKCELGAHRTPADVLAGLAAGRARLAQLFGARVAPVLVPPWNRIAPGLVPQLPGIGFAALSTFGPDKGAGVPGLERINCDLDVIDWHNGRRGVAPALLNARLLGLLASARAAGGAPVGILAHHLVHDAAAWDWLETVLAHTHSHPAVQWQQALQLCKNL